MQQLSSCIEGTISSNILKEFLLNVRKFLTADEEKFRDIREVILEQDLFQEFTFKQNFINDLTKKITANMNDQQYLNSLRKDNFCLQVLKESIMNATLSKLQSPAGSLFFAKPKESKTIKQRAFCRVVKNALIEYYFVSRALYEQKVDPASGVFDEIKGAVEIIVPSIAGVTGIIGGLIATGGVAMLKFIKFVKDKNTRWQAARFVEAFGVAGPNAVKDEEKGIRIDHDKVKAVTDILYKRYCDQIEQCTLSVVGQDGNTISLTKGDGIAALAQCMADRIFKHIINGGSKNSGQDKNIIVKFWDAMISIFDEKDVYVETKNFSITERCIFALFKEDEGKDFEILTETTIKNPKLSKWQAGGVLVKTGLKIFDESTNTYKLYVRIGEEKVASLHDEYGFCYIENEIEFIQRHYILAPKNIEDKFAKTKIPPLPIVTGAAYS
jgi:hypothetical protein